MTLNGKYFIGGLSRDTTSETLKAYFELFGELADAVVMMKEGRSRGFGFVTFAFPQDVPPNFVTSMHVVDGKQVDVKIAIPEEELQLSTGVKKLFVGGLTITTTREHLEQHFGQFGVLTDAVVMETNGRPRGFGFVTFETEEQAETAYCYTPGHVIDNKTVDVKKAEPKGSPNLTSGQIQKMATTPQQEFYLPRHMPSLQYSAQGFPVLPLAGPARNYRSAEVQPTAKIFVGGLAHHTAEDSLLAYFSQFGNVVAAEVMRRDGIPRGFGFVVFSHQTEALLALTQVNHVIDGKPVEAKICQPRTPGFSASYALIPAWSSSYHNNHPVFS
jgi:RNA recognition motif-containing protein